MAKLERFLVIDIGSTAVHVGEFETLANDTLVLLGFDNMEYNEPLTEQNRTEVISEAIDRAMATGKYSSKSANLCVSGQAAFMRFVKLPPVTDDETSVRQIVQFEAKQNVPFPIEEVVWDYQLIAREDDEDELEVMFAVIKNEIVDSVIAAVKKCGLKPATVDFSPAALYNAARANYVGEQECAMLLDIGGKCTTLLFLEGGRFFARSIPIAGAAISQQIAKEFSISAEEAEVLKRRYGFVALGGAYEEPESEVAATISKIIRNVMTRLHGEINRTINIYRSQQKGSKPTKLLLAGGSSTMAFTDHFFSEKLRMEVGYFNAFQIVSKSNRIDLDELGQLAHLFPEIVGVALRHLYPCPVEINLTTRDIRSEGDIKKRVPFIWASCFVWLLILGICWFVNTYQVRRLDARIKLEKAQNDELSKNVKKMDDDIRDAKSFTTLYEGLGVILDSRYRWNGLFNALQLAKPIDVWVTEIKMMAQAPDMNNKAAAAAAAAADEPGVGSIFEGPGGGAAAKKKDGKDQVEWLAIRGYAVRIPEVDKKTGKLIRPLFTQDQVNQFDVEDLRRRQEIKEGRRKLKKGEVLPKLNFLGADRANFVTDKVHVADVFQQSLLFSDYFSDNPEEVQLLEHQTVSQSAKNMKKFLIILKAKAPIQIKRD